MSASPHLDRLNRAIPVFEAEIAMITEEIVTLRSPHLPMATAQGFTSHPNECKPVRRLRSQRSHYMRMVETMRYEAELIAEDLAEREPCAG